MAPEEAASGIFSYFDDCNSVLKLVFTDPYLKLQRWYFIQINEGQKWEHFRTKYHLNWIIIQYRIVTACMIIIYTYRYHPGTTNYNSGHYERYHQWYIWIRLCHIHEGAMWWTRTSLGDCMGVLIRFARKPCMLGLNQLRGWGRKCRWRHTFCS